jgi:MFS family permease
MNAIEQSALRKAACRLVPVLTIAYVFNYLDRTVVGFAALTMNRDVGLSATQFGVGAGMFFVSYCLFEIPSNLALYRFGARRWIARIMMTWGLVSAATVFVVGPLSFYAVRLLLGLAEAGFFASVTYYLAAWFPARMRTRMLAWFLLGIPLSSVIGAPISGLLLALDGIWGCAGWQWLFIGVSLPCVALGLVVLRLLADKPQDAPWLTAEERAALAGLLASESRERPRSELWPALKDLRVLLLAVVQFGFTLSSYGIGIWLPLMLRDYKLSNLAISLVAAVPYLFASATMMACAWRVDRTGRKIVNLVITCCLAAAGLVVSVLTGELLLALTGLTLALIGVTTARAIFWTIPTRFLAGVGAAAGLAFINSIGTAGGFFEPALMGWLKDATGSFQSGLLAMAGIMLATALVAASLKLIVKEE